MTKPVARFALIRSYSRLVIAGPGYIAMAVATSLLLLLATLRGGRETADAISSFQSAVSHERAAWEENAPAQWLAAGVRRGRWGYLPPLASQVFAEGISKLQESSCHTRVGIAPAHRLDLTDGSASWVPELHRLGSLDLGYVSLFLLPLFALFVSYDSVSGEKACGTLRCALATGISRRHLFVAKLTSSFVAVWLPSVLAVLLGLAFSALLFRAPWPGALRLATFLGILTSYIAFYLCVGVLASTCTSSPRTSLAVVMTVWVLCCFVQPRASTLATTLVRPFPSSVSFEIKKRAVLAEARRSYLEEHHSGATQNWMLERLQLARTTVGRERLLQREQDSLQTHARRLTDTALLFSPFGLAQSALLEIAGTSTHRYEEFRQACNDYRWQLTDHFASALSHRSASDESGGARDLPLSQAKAILDTTPSFVFRDAEPRSAAVRSWLRVMALFSLALLLGLIAARSFDRYDAR